MSLHEEDCLQANLLKQASLLVKRVHKQPLAGLDDSHIAFADESSIIGETSTVKEDRD